jgi:hypothetical protein
MSWYITQCNLLRANRPFGDTCCLHFQARRISNDRLCGLVVRVLATDPEARVRFPALPGKKKVVGLERGPLSLVSTTEELLDRKVAAPV